MKLAFGYNTNGFAHHRLEEALAIIADLGCDGVALTLDVHHLDPFRASPRDVAKLRRRLERLNLRCVVETGARFLLNPHRKHEPTLISPEREGRKLRLTFLESAMEISRELGAEAVSFWSGVKQPSVSDPQARRWLEDGCRRLAEFAVKKRVVLAFEPEPGMFVQDMADYARLRRSAGESLDLTLDVGHVFCTERRSFAKVWDQFAPLVRNVHIEDIRGRRHEHLAFGEGEIDFRPVLAAMKNGGYKGLVNVELSRDSHRAPEMARRAIEFLRGLEKKL